MLQKTLSVCLYFSLCTMAFAQDSFLVKGTILSANALQPIEGATISGNDLFSITTSTGNFTLKNVKQGTHTLTITSMGFTPKVITIDVCPELQDVIVYLKESTTDLDEIEVHGKSKKREIMETPVVSHTVSEEFLNKNRENSLMQTLSKIPGVSTISIGSGQSKPVIRGLGFNRVAVVQNGVKHEAQQWGNDHGLEIDQYGIENIQIIKGPASLVYGSDAIAGVVDIQPNSVPLMHSFQGELNVIGQTNNDLIGVSVGIDARKHNWYYGGRLTYRDYADYKVPTDKISFENYIFDLHDNNLRNTAGEEANASFNIGYITDNIESETTFSNVYAKNGFFANAHGLEVRTSDIDYDSSSRDIDLPYHTVNHFKITNNTSILSGDHTFLFDLGYQNNLRKEYSEPVPHGYMPKPPNNLEREFNKNTYALNIRDAFTYNEKHELVLGINIDYQDNSIGGWGFLIPNYNRFTAGAFAFDTFEITPDLHVLAGIRYDYGLINTKAYFDWFPSTITNEDGTTSSVYVQRAQNKSLNFGNISASAGLSYINGNTTYKVNIGKSFRMPLANELASDGVNYHMYRFEKGNLDLDPEESYQLDFELDHSTETFSIGISPFVNYFENFIYLNPTSDYYEVLQIYEYTQSEVFRIGGELSASTTIFNKLEIDASAEYVYSRQTSGPKKGFSIPFSPPLSAMLSANYQLNDLSFFKKPQLMADYRITAAQEEIVPPEEVTEGYQVFSMSFFTELDVFKTNAPLELQVKLNNVFDTKYYDHTSFYRLIDVPEAGRNLSLSITIPF